jgi:signal transduction histidine kinase
MVGNDNHSIVPVRTAVGTPPQVSPAGVVVKASRKSPRWRPRNWRVRWRVLALVLVPTLAALALGGLRIEAANATAASAARTSQLGVVGSAVTTLAEAVADERDLSAGFVAAQQNGRTAQATSIYTQVLHQAAVTDADAATVRGLAAGIGSAYPGAAQSDLSAGLSSLAALPELRKLAHTGITPLTLSNHYSNVIGTLLTFDNDIAAGSSSAQLAQTVTSADALAQVEEETSQQRAVLYASLIAGQFEPGALTALTGAQSSEASAQTSFQKVANDLPSFTPGPGAVPSFQLSEEQQFNNVVAGPDIDAGLAIEQNAVVDPATLTGGPQAWFSDMGFTLKTQRSVLGDELASATEQANTLQRGAASSERLTLIVVAVLLLLVLAITIVMARSMIIPLRRLRADALDVAGHRLPAMVQRLSQQESGESIQIEPIGVDSSDEIGEVARAFDQVHGEAVRLAAEEALLRANLNAMFVNLSRRSQSLIERQLGIIEGLEQSEQEPDRLNSLFRLDHLATRMRRNSENLLVLAGHEAPRKWTKPVPLVDVLRAAVSEIEQYERITLNVQAGLMIAGRAASDVVHLTAELAENATTFSREDTQVRVSGQQVSSGGVLIEITDDGLGIPEEELAHANWRLDNPPVIDVAVSRRMGLFVVGRLAARHGIRVRLRQAGAGVGLSALIWVPDSVAESEPVEMSVADGRLRPVTGSSPVVVVGASATATGTLSTRPLPNGTGPIATGPFAPAGGTPIPRSATWFSNPPEKASAPAPARAPASAPASALASAEPQPALLAEPAGTWDTEQVTTVPPAESTSGHRLPIFDSVESDWFRRGTPRGTVANSAPGTGTGRPRTGWKPSPADEGFRRAAATAAAPAADPVTTAGLPKRRAGANLVPGSVTPRPAADRATAAAPANATVPTTTTAGLPARPARSAEEVRARMSGFQHRGRAGREKSQQEN